MTNNNYIWAVSIPVNGIVVDVCYKCHRKSSEL